MKPNQIIKIQPNYITPLLLIVVIFILSCIATSCKTDKQTTHFSKIEHHVKYKKVTGYKPSKRVIRKCYAYE